MTQSVCIRIRLRLIVGLPAVSLLGLVGCGGGSTALARPTSYEMHHPKIVPNPSHHPDSLYVPNPIRIQVGQSVTWTNHDTDPHDVTSVNGLFFSGPIATGASYTMRFTRPGTYRYFCTIHPDMHGQVIVTR